MAVGAFQKLVLGTNLTGTDNGDESITIDAAGGSASTDGWTAAGVTFTYASGSGGGVATFTAPGDLTAVYVKGARIKLTQTTVKYFVCLGSSHAAGTTTVTIMAGTDYTLANAAITLPYYSYEVIPAGYPGTFNWAAAPTGFAAGVGVVAKFAIHGRTCFCIVDFLGTSNATTLTFTLPASALAASNITNPCYTTDAGVTSVNPGLFNNSGTTACDVYRTLTLLGWTNVGTKRALGQFFYPI